MFHTVVTSVNQASAPPSHFAIPSPCDGYVNFDASNSSFTLLISVNRAAVPLTHFERFESGDHTYTVTKYF